MTSQQLDSQSQQLKTRVASLEEELAQLRQLSSELLKKRRPEWMTVVGSFEDDLTFDEATRLGGEWRKSAES